MKEARELGFWTHQVAFSMSACLDHYLNEHGTKAITFGLLQCLSTNEGISLVELSRLIKRSHPAVLRMIDFMEQDGLLVREGDPVDRRVKHMYITDQGRELLEEMLPFAEKVREIATRNVKPEELSQAMAVLKRITENLREKLEQLKSE